jgi:signal transduction histidine kinase
LLEKTRELGAHIDSTIKMVRRIATELRPGILDHLGLGAALEWQANEFQTRTGIRCDVESGLSEMALDADINTALFRIFQETLTNIIRHAGATHVAVHLKERGDRVILGVRDNGRGISKAEISNTKSMGLLNMRERAALLGGDFKISRIPGGKGTRVVVSIPLQRPKTVKAQNENPVNRRSRSRPPRVEANSG